MFKLILKLILFAAIILSISYRTFYLNPKYENDFLASLSLKLDKLEKIENNKIVIIGGSSACIGINSEMVENETGIPTVNMALHAALGPKFWLEYVKNNLKEGDILIISPEYGMLEKEKWYGMKGEAVPKAILYTPSKLPILLNDYELFKKTFVGIFRTIKAYWKEHPFEKPKHNIKYLYDLRSFDEDNIKAVYLNAEFKRKYYKSNMINLEFDKEVAPWQELKEYKDYFDKLGIEFYLTPPSILDESIYIDKAKDFFKKLSEESTIPVLNDNYNCFFNRPLINDTNYHLNAEGIEERTNQLIEDIKTEFLNSERIKNKKRIFLSQNTFEEVNLDHIIMIHNIDVKRYGQDSILIQPSRENKIGFIKYKTKFRDYIGSLLKLTVKCEPEIINKLKFRGGKNYDFDYVKRLDLDTYLLCKNLSNVIVHPNDYSSTSIGIGYDAGGLNVGDEFMLLSATIIDGDLNCDEVLEYINLSEYIISNYNSSSDYIIKDNPSIIFKVNSFDNSKFNISDILNINSDLILRNKHKYKLEFNKDKVFLYDFYKEGTIFEQKIKEYPVKFINSPKREIEIVF